MRQDFRVRLHQHRWLLGDRQAAGRPHVYLNQDRGMQSSCRTESDECLDCIEADRLPAQSPTIRTTKQQRGRAIVFHVLNRIRMMD